jgi:imidazolonepropionase-like amidohydrolase
VVFPAEGHASRDTYVMAHAYTDAAVRRCLAAGVRSIEHGNFVSQETVAMIGRAGAFLVPTFISLVQRLESADQHHLAQAVVANLKRTIERGHQVYAWARKHGVPIGLGTLAEAAHADLLVVDGDPLADIGVLLDPQRHLKLIMKDGVLYKNELPA